MSDTAEKDAADFTEYRVLWWSDEHQRWFSHTGALATNDPKIAAAWEGQARTRGGRRGPVKTAVESRKGIAWTRVFPPASTEGDA
jgi:hypothetical protein